MITKYSNPIMITKYSNPRMITKYLNPIMITKYQIFSLLVSVMPHKREKISNRRQTIISSLLSGSTFTSREKISGT